MRMLMKLFRMFTGGGGRTATRSGVGRSRRRTTTAGGGIGSMIRRFLR